MTSIKTLGIDLGKHNFHLIGRNAQEHTVLRKKLSRAKLLQFITQLEPCTIAFESCGGAHWLARFCLQSGHQVKLIPPQFVKPYVKSNKNDFNDADAIAEASGRPGMRFVEPKPESSQVIAACHRIREGFVTERTAVMTRIGAILLEFGFALPKGHKTIKELFFWLAKQSGGRLPEALLHELQVSHEHYLYLNERIAAQDQKIKDWVKQDELCQLVKTIPGVGDMVASQLIAKVGNAQQFKNGRDMAASLGLVPRQYSTGDKTVLLGISKRGDKSLRCLFVHGARAVLSRLDSSSGPFTQWLKKLREKKPFNVACIALANKLVRIAWAVLTRRKAFDVEMLTPGLQAA